MRTAGSRKFYKRAYEWIGGNPKSRNKAGAATQSVVKVNQYCHYCGADCYKHGYTRDHVTPRSEGGKITVTCCVKCNRLKGLLHLEEFRFVMAFRAGKIESIKSHFSFFGEKK